MYNDKTIASLIAGDEAQTILIVSTIGILTKALPRKYLKEIDEVIDVFSKRQKEIYETLTQR